MQLIIKMLTGYRIIVEIYKSQTILDLKTKIFNQEEIPISRQRIICTAKSTSDLEENLTIDECNFTPESDIFCILKIQEPKIFDIQMTVSETLGSLYDKIMELIKLEPIPKYRQNNPSVTMPDIDINKTLSEYGWTPNSEYKIWDSNNDRTFIVHT